MLTNNKKKLVTHNGSFHSDDVFACAVLCILLEKRGEEFEIIRTRDPEIINSADYVFDVGGIYDPGKNRFDHHQRGGAGKHNALNPESAVEYASFGLVWEKYGTDLCGSEKVADFIDNKLVAPIDAFDNGFDLVENKYGVTPYYIQHLLFSMRPTWKEDSLSKDEMFLKTVEIAKVCLTREIIHVQDDFLAEDLVTVDYADSKDKRIIILKDKYPFGKLSKFPEPLFAIYPRPVTSDFGVEAVRDNPKTFVSRKDFPVAWAGLRDEELAKISGVPDAIFCHRGLYLVVAGSLEGAIKLAQIAVES